MVNKLNALATIAAGLTAGVTHRQQSDDADYVYHKKGSAAKTKRRTKNKAASKSRKANKK